MGVTKQNIFFDSVSSQAIHIEDGAFSWDKEEKAVLQK